MSPERQRIAIAGAIGAVRGSALGYTHGQANELYLSDPDGGYHDLADWSKKYRWLRLYDPLNDFNAMFEAFKHLGRHWQIAQVHDGYYCSIQFGKGGKDIVVAGLELLPVMSEAFLRALNIWEESNA